MCDLKYYLYNLYEAQNMDNTSEEELIQIDKQWEQNNLTYQEIFQRLENRLPSNIFQHFNGWGFHDSRLVKVEFEHTSFLKLNINFIISNDAAKKKDEKFWILSFKNVSQFQFQHLNARNEACVFHREIDDWLYQEFLPVDEYSLSFEVLFSSGANISLQFPNNDVTLDQKS